MQANPESSESGTRHFLSDGLHRTFADEGYSKFEGVISKKKPSRLRERAFVALPRIGTAYHAVRSLF